MNHPELARHRILVVDDQEEPRGAIERALKTIGHEVETARDGPEALAKLRLDIDLVVLDANMPGMDGFEVARRIRADPEDRDTPIIMVTGLHSREDRLRAVEAGVNDFVAKPFELTELRVRTASLLRMKDATDALKRHRHDLEEAVSRRTSELRSALEQTADAERRTYGAHLDTIRRLVLAAEYKDWDTAAHIERIGSFCALIARALSFSPGEIEVIRYASEMHDVGKIGVPDVILLKPGRLEPHEWEIMKEHTTIGAHILSGSPSAFLQMGETIARCHHERWEGTGYPSRLAGEAIPLPARICAVADVFDAVTSQRHYRDALPNKVVIDMMKSQRGRHFDPDVLDTFLEHRQEIEEIQKEGREMKVKPPSRR